MGNPRIQKTILLLLFCMMLSVTFFQLIRDIRDPDFFWHLKTGQWIWQHGEIPVKDPFSFTTIGLQSIREHFIMSSYWLSQVIFWLSYFSAGMVGIVLLKFAIVGSIFLAMVKRREGDRVLYAGLLLLFLSLLLKSYPVERPQAFSFLFFAVMLYLLKGRQGNDGARQADSRYGRSLFITLPLLMLVWANMHAGYVVGVATIVIFMAFEGLKFISPALGQMRKSDYRILLCGGIVGILSSFVNPNTYHVFSGNILFPYDYVISGNIEFQSTISMFSRYHDHSVIIYWCILSLTAAGFLFTIKKMDITEAALLAATGYFSFTAVRYVAFFLIAALPAVGRTFSDSRLLKSARALMLASAISTAIFFAQDYLTLGPLSSGRWVDGQKFPVAASDFIQTSDLSGNMYNYFDWGGYLIWRLAPEKKVFIDGRTLYPHIYHQSDLIDKADGRRIGNMPAWKAVLEAYNIQYTITPVSLPLVRALFEDKEWVPIFSRNESVIFVRDAPENQHVIEKYALDKGALLLWLTHNADGKASGLPI